MSPFNLHVKRPIEYIVILIGRIDSYTRDNCDSIIYAFSRNFRDRVALSEREGFISMLHLVCPRRARVAIFCTK